MTDGWTRRDALGQVLAGGTMVSTSSVPRSVEQRDSPEAPYALGLFTGAAGRPVPAGATVVETSGFARIGEGAARYAYDRQVDAAFLRAHPRTAFIADDGRGFVLATRMIDVRQTGAVGDGRADDTAALQAALDTAELVGGGMVSLPPGEFRITTTLTLPGRVDLVGSGPSSVIRAVACNGVAIAASNAIAPRRIADLSILGAGGERFISLSCDLEPPARAQGLVVERVYIALFGTGVRGRGLWHSSFRSVTMNNVRNGFAFVDQNVKILIDDGRLTRGALLGGEGGSVGVQIGDGEHRQRPEDVQIVRSLVYGFAKAIVWRTALFGNVIGCDLDACVECGLELVTADGGFTFRDNWVQIQGGGSASYGINGTALGYVPEPGRVTIADNRVGRAGAAGGIGIHLGHNQSNVDVRGNSVAGPWAEALRIDGAMRVACLGNRLEGPAWIGNTRSTMVSDNWVRGVPTFVANDGLVAERNLRS